MNALAPLSLPAAAPPDWLAAVFGGAVDAVAVCPLADADPAAVAYANAAFLALAGRPGDDVLGRPLELTGVIAPGSAEWAAVRAAEGAGRATRAVVPGPADGPRAAVEVTAQVSALPDGPRYLVWTFRPVPVTDPSTSANELLAATNRMANVGGWEYDTRTDALRWTEQTFRIHDLPPGRQPTVAEAVAFYHPDDRPRIDQAVRRSLADGTPFAGEFRLITAAGRTIWTRSQGQAVTENGRVTRLAGAFQDITEQKRAEDAFRDQSARLAALGDNLPDGMIFQYRQWPDGRRAMPYCSAGCRRLFGVLPDAAVADVDLLFALVHPDDLRDLLAAVERSRASLGVFEVEVRACLPGEVAKWVHIRSTPRPLDDGGVEWDGVMLDVTEREAAEREAVEARDRYARLLNSLDVVIWEADPVTFQFTFVSRQAETIFGYPLAEWTGNPSFWADHIHPDDRAATLAYCLEECRRSRSHDFEYRMLAADGRVVWVYDRVQVAAGRDGPIRLFGVIQDITAQVRAREQLAARDAQFRTVAENMPDGLVVLDPHDTTVPLRILYANPALAASAGFAPAELLGRSIIDLDAPESAALAAERGRRVMAGELVEFEARHRHRDGSLVPMEVRALRIPWDGREAVLGINRNMTERRRAEAELRRVNERFTLAAEAAGIGVWEYYPDDDRLAWDERMFRLFRVDPAAFTGDLNAWRRTVHPGDLAATEAALAQSVVGGDVLEVRFRIVCPGGEVRHLRGIARTIREGGLRVTGVNYDVTEQARAEERRRLMEDQLRQSQKLEAIGHLAGGVAHDFNNLLTVVTGYSQLMLLTLPIDDPNREAVAAIAQAGDRGVAITRQLLAFGRKQIVRGGTVDVNEAVRAVRALFPRLLGEHIQCAFRPCPEPATVAGDAGQIDQILLNLAVNARDAMPRGGRLEIAADVTVLAGPTPDYPEATAGRYVRLTVADTGCGMDARTKARIFEPFFTTKEVGQGTGLGLATVYGIVKSLGGHIAVESAVGAGTTFRLLLPAGSAVAAAVGGGSTTVAEGGGEWVLLVEDDDTVRQFARMLLERQGYRVTAVESGEQALATVGRSTGDLRLLVTDVVMPGMNGRELAEALAARRPDLPVVFVSGYTDDMVFRQGVARDEVRFVPKPFTAAALLAAVREALDAARPNRRP